MHAGANQLSLDDLFAPAAGERRGEGPPDAGLSAIPGAARRPARRYVPEWEREHRRLSAYRRRARRSDGAPWSVDEQWPRFRESLARLAATARPLVDPDALEPYLAHRRTLNVPSSVAGGGGEA